MGTEDGKGMETGRRLKEGKGIGDVGGGGEWRCGRGMVEGVVIRAYSIHQT